MRRALIEAALAAFIALFLALPIIGLRLQEGALQWRPMAVLWTLLAVFLGRFGWLLGASWWRRGLSVVAPRWRFSLPVERRLALADFLHRQRRQGMLLLLLLLLLLPFFSSRSLTDLMTLALIYVMLGLGLNIVVGYAGLLDLGYVAFYAVGAYSYALLHQYFGFGFWSSLPIAVLLAGLTGFVLGFPVLRLRGDYLAIVTLGFGEIIRLVLNNWDQLTGGPDGIGSIPRPMFFGIEFNRRPQQGGQPFHELLGMDYSSHYKIIFLYVLALFFVCVLLYLINRLIRMPVGRAWEALREDELACRSLGLNPTFIKLSAFTIGASCGGFAGAFFAARQGFINPESFAFIESALILAIVVLGGMGSQAGVILAAFAITLLPELAREFNEYRMLLFGLVMVWMMIRRPQGLLPAKRPEVRLE